jgi:hypothetical protein
MLNTKFPRWDQWWDKVQGIGQQDITNAIEVNKC